MAKLHDIDNTRPSEEMMLTRYKRNLGNSTNVGALVFLLFITWQPKLSAL